MDKSDGSFKYLDYLQSSIDRLAGYGFIIKGWSVTIACAFLGLYIKEGDWRYALVAFGPITIFWLLDCYFLALERALRVLFTEATGRLVRGDPPTYNMTPAPPDLTALAQCSVRPVILLVHGSLALAVLAVCLLR